MNINKTFWLGLIAAAALAAAGCGDSGSSDNTGGSGGMPMGMANLTAVHLAPEVPTADSTAVALFVNGEEVTDLGTLSYSQSTGKIPLPAGTYESIGVGLPGGEGPILELENVTLNDGDDVVVVAYRTGDETAPVGFFVFPNSTEGLDAANGRVFVGHGADDPALETVNISTGSADTMDCMTLIPEFGFGTTFPAAGEDNVDLQAATYALGFDVADDACPEVGPVDVTVTANIVSILVAVDEDTADFDGDTGLSAELWAIIPDADDPQPVRTIQTQ